MQVRLWAQGLTIGVVIAAATLTHAQRAKAMEMRQVRLVQLVETCYISLDGSAQHGDRSWQYAVRWSINSYVNV